MSHSPSSGARRTVSALATALLALAAPLAAPVVPVAAAAGNGEVSTVGYTAAERAAALSHWAPARMKQVGRAVDLAPTGPIGKPWTGKGIQALTPGERPHDCANRARVPARFAHRVS
ncbi:hypothetical protein [Streptomyces sp. NPDC008137]|uniref:hypothetical protein n=1 Tax=Streptomyces sp. NPDC008137 TaxID=3364813 RepID=UPI0036EC8136